MPGGSNQLLPKVGVLVQQQQQACMQHVARAPCIGQRGEDLGLQKPTVYTV